MRKRAPSGLLVLVVALFGPVAARADGTVESCKRTPGSALCREVRRLCAMRAVRDEVVSACKELGYWGETTYREITNLCPLDPTHPDCQKVKTLCESEHAAQIEGDGEKLCREMGWGSYAYSHLGEEEAAPGADEATPDLSDLGSPPLEPALPEAGTSVSARPVPAAAWGAGVASAGLRLGLVDDAALVGGHDALYSGHLQITSYSFSRLPLAAALVGDLGVAGASSHIVYQADVLVGPGRWWTPHLALGVLGGVGLSGISGGDEPFAVELPVRLAGVAHAGDRVTLEGWAQLGWLIDPAAARQSGSRSVGFADAAELGAALVWGERPAAGGVAGAGFWLGALYQEQNDTRIVSIMVGLGATRNPWVP